MIWIISIVSIYLLTLILISGKILVTRKGVENSQTENLSRAKEELETKTKLTNKLASLVLGLTTTEKVKEAEDGLSDFESILGAEKGKQAIAEAEIEALDIRLRELEELRRELEVSNMDAIKEVEMLKAQERDMSNKNLGIQDQLKSSLDQIDILMDMLSNNVKAQEELNKSKTQLIEVEKNITFYEQEITKINKQYVALKRAYDALDIEYAQLYEKRQQQMENGG